MKDPLPNRSKPTPEPIVIDITPQTGRRRPSRLVLLAGICGLLLIALAVEIFMVPDAYLEAWHGEGPSSYAPEIKVVEQGEKRFLWGGDSETMRFDVTDCILELDRLHHGLGREAFPALIRPRFVLAEKASKWLAPDDRVLSVAIGSEIKVYPVNLLIRHEVVNDIVGGRPIFAAYCILADLGAVYDRKIGDHVFTFGVSGYTYAHADIWNGRDAFVLWDRDTESLWWPPTGEAVAGPLLGVPLNLLEKAHWNQTTWAQIKSQYPEALVLDKGQDFERPKSWPRCQIPDDLDALRVSKAAIAPKWGENQ